MGHVGEHLLERRRAAGHLETDVESLTHPELGHRVGDARPRHVDRECQAYGTGQLEPVIRHVGDDDVTRAGMTGNDRRHDPDRAGSRDEDVLTEDRESQRGMDGVSERVEDGRHVEVDASQVAPDVRGRQRDVFRESPREIDPDPLYPGTLHTPARDAVAAPPADQMALTAHEVTHLEVVDVDAELHDLADEFVADDQRHRDVRLRPGVP